jgi:hypothetical protein
MKWIIKRWAGHRAASVREPKKRVAIMVPLTSATLNEDEAISMRHLRTHLDDHEKYLLVPEGLDVEINGSTVMPLDRAHFGSAANHNRMLYRTDFWEKFADYEYVLMYHLDALVFSDQLQDWCDKGIDFIGAPFLHCESSPWVEEERVGNGGFALYRVPSIQRVLWNRYLREPSKYVEDRCWKLQEFNRRILAPIRAAMPKWLRGKATSPIRNKLKRMDHIEVNERGNDLFWSDEARHYFPEFKTGTLEQGLAFAFETEPGSCLKRTDGRMPFGCHAWGRYDRGFWEPFLLRNEEHAPSQAEGI